MTIVSPPDLETAPAPQPAAPRGREASVFGRLVSPANLLPTLLLLSVIFMVVYPLAMIVIGSFKEGVPASPGPLTTEGWREVFTDASTYKTLWTSLSIAVPRSLLTLMLASTFAWLLTRTNIPAKPVLFAMLTFMFFLPDLPWILAWGLLGSDQVGLLNQWISTVIPGADFINVYSYWGLVILGACRGSVFLFFFLYPSFLAMDASLEEAARMSGASQRRTALRIVVPLMTPALLGAYVFSLINSLSSFELERLLGTRAGITVFTTSIYNDIYGGQDKFAAASAQAMMLLVLTFGLLIIQFRLLKGRSFTTVTGRGFRAKPMDIGKWRWPAMAGMMLFFLFMGALPSAVLLLQSFMRFPGLLRLDLFTTDNWVNALEDPFVLRSIQNTVVVALSAATIGVVVSYLISYIAVRSKWRGRRPLEFIAWLPWAVPGTVLALGFLYAFVALPIYGTLAIIVLAFVVRGLPIGMRFTSPSLLQISPEIEESARIHGGSWTRTSVRILAPLTRPAILGAWVFLFVVAVRVLDTILVLTSPGTRVISVDIFNAATTGGDEGQAYVLAIVQAAIVFVGYAIARTVTGRDAIVKGA
jgi:iron(III) transport system permease protein